MKFSELYKAYWERHASVRLKCPENVYYFWRVHGQQWADREIDSVKEHEVQDWFDRLAARSKSAAVRAVNQFSAIINWGIRRRYIQHNPCGSVDKIKIPARDRFLLPDEIERFKRALAEEPQDMQDFFWMCLLTGARRGNVESMEWREIDEKLGIWRIPPEKYKNGEAHLVPLTDAALAILQRRLSARQGSPFVFPSCESATGHIVEPKRSWKRILKRAELKDLRIHDLRRTVGSYMAIEGESLLLIGKALGHIDPRSTAIYAKLHLTPVRKALKRAQGAFFSALPEVS